MLLHSMVVIVELNVLTASSLLSSSKSSCHSSSCSRSCIAKNGLLFDPNPVVVCVRRRTSLATSRTQTLTNWTKLRRKSPKRRQQDEEGGGRKRRRQEPSFALQIKGGRVRSAAIVDAVTERALLSIGKAETLLASSTFSHLPLPPPVDLSFWAPLP